LKKNNPTISVNIFGYLKDVYPLRISKYKQEIDVNLLLIDNREKQYYE